MKHKLKSIEFVKREGWKWFVVDERGIKLSLDDLLYDELKEAVDEADFVTDYNFKKIPAYITQESKRVPYEQNGDSEAGSREIDL